MAKHVFNRRGILGAMAIAPVVAAVPAVAAAQAPSQMEALWADYVKTCDRWNDPSISDEEDAILEKRLNEIKAQIEACNDKTPRGIEIRIWYALAPFCYKVADGAAQRHENIEFLTARCEQGELEWGADALLGVIRSIRA